MAASFETAFKGVRTVLVKFIDVSNGLLDELYDRDVLTTRHIDNIKVLSTESDRAGKMLDILERRPDEMLSAFKEALLATAQKHIWDKYLSTAVAAVPVHVNVTSNNPENSPLLKTLDEDLSAKLIAVSNLLNRLPKSEISSVRSQLSSPDLNDFERDLLKIKLDDKIDEALGPLKTINPGARRTLVVFFRHMILYGVEPDYAHPTQSIVIYLLCGSSEGVVNVGKMVKSGILNSLLKGVVEEHLAWSIDVAVRIRLNPDDYQAALACFDNQPVILDEDPETTEASDSLSTLSVGTTNVNDLIEVMNKKINDLEVNQKWLAVRLKQAEEEGQRLLFYDAERKILKEQRSSVMRTEKELIAQLKEILANVQRQMFERNSWQIQSDVIQAGVVQQLQDDPMKGDEIQDDTVPPYEVLPIELNEMILLKTFTLFFKVIPVYNSLGSISAPGMPGFNCGVGLMTEQDRLCMASIPCYMTLSVVCYKWHMTMIGWPTSRTRHWFKHKLHRALKRLIKENQYVLSHNYELLSRCLVVTDELLDRLASIGLIRHKTSDIKRQATDFAKTDAFLRILWEIPQSQQQSVFDALRSALRKDGQEHVANIFLSESDASPMSDEHYQILVSKQEQLSLYIDPLGGLIDELVNCDIFTDRDRNLVTSEAGDDAMSRKLVDILLRKPDSAFDKFMNALCITNQEHVASLLGYDTECIPLTEERRKLLVDKAAEVAEIMEAGSLLDSLVANDVLTAYNEKQIRGQNDNENMSHQLLKVLQRKSNTDFDKFILALCKTNQEHVASLLGQDTANIPMTAEHRQLLMIKTKELCNFINPSFDLLNALEILDVFTRRDAQSVRDKTTYDEMSLELINILIRKSDISFDKFIEALNKSGQPHVASLLGHECSEKPMTDEHRQLLIKKKGELAKFMDPANNLMDALLYSGVLDSNDRKQIIKEQDIEAMCRHLIDILLRKSDAAFDSFISALCASKQEHVASLLGYQTTKIPMTDEHRQLLKSKKNELAKFMDTISGLMDMLVNSDVLSSEDEIQIKNEHSIERMCLYLIDILLRKSDAAFDWFVSALIETKQEHVASLLGYECYEKPMSEEHRQLLLSKTEELSHCINPTNRLLNRLAAVDVLNKRDIDRVVSMRNYTDMTSELLNILLRKSDSSFDKFIEVLNSTEQQHVVHILTGEGESPLSHLRRLVLRKARTKLVSNVDSMCTSLLVELISNGVLTYDDKYHIEAHKVNEDRTAELIDIIARKSHVAYDRFIQALKDSGHSMVAAELEALELKGRIDPHFFSNTSLQDRETIIQLVRNNMKTLVSGTGDEVKAITSLMEQNGFAVSQINDG